MICPGYCFESHENIKLSTFKIMMNFKPNHYLLSLKICQNIDCNEVGYILIVSHLNPGKRFRSQTNTQLCLYGIIHLFS